jgi:hypothetical protein
MSKKLIGKIELGEVAFLSDSCYGTNSKWNCTMKVVPGIYNIYITRAEHKDDFYKGRISNLIAIHKDYYKKHKTLPTDDKEQLFCAVDSGTCGIYDGEYFSKYHTEDDVDDEWYENNVIEMDEFTITDGKGAITSSGCGDGLYRVFASYDKENAFALRIKYL